MEFDRFSIALLVLRPDRPRLDKKAEAELQDAHMAHLADLHEAGYLLAAGPLLGEAGRKYRGRVKLGLPPVPGGDWGMSAGAGIIELIGRILFSSFFVYAGRGHVVNSSTYEGFA